MDTFICFVVIVVAVPLSGAKCPPGHISHLDGSCTDDDECNTTTRCPSNSKCYNTIGSYYCTCTSGFSSSSGKANFSDVTLSCDDINECRGKHAVDCGANAVCNNTAGSYDCYCNTGYYSSSGNVTFMSKSESTCKDINECLTQVNCGQYAACRNTPGGHYCTCIKGFISSSGKANFTSMRDSTCQDVDECNTIGICGNFSACINTKGSYTCTCQQGFQSKSGKDNFTDVAPSGCVGFCVDESSTEIFEKDQALGLFVKNLSASCRSASQSESENTEDYEDLLSIPDQYLKERKRGTGTKNGLAVFLGAMENMTMLLAHKLKKPMCKKKYLFEIIMEVIAKQQFSDEVITLNQTHVDVSITGNTVAGNEQADYAVVALITYEDISANMQPERDEGTYEEENKGTTKFDTNTDYDKTDYELKDVELVSRVISVMISNINRHNLATSVNITFKHLQEKNDTQEMRCAFLNNTAAQAFWSYEGCKTAYEGSNVTCQCNHLSSFAVLMAHYEIENFTLTIITYVGLCISLICLAISIFTFYFCRAIQGPRTRIHLHLCVCLFMGYFIFLVGINQTKNEVGCGVVAGLLHYFFLATFTWMCLEGVQLYLMVVEVFSTNSLKKRYMFAFGYGLPLVIVILSASLNAKGYGTKKHCWLSLQHGFLWSFLAPVCVIILVNSVFFIITVWKLAEKFSSLNPELCKFKKIRVFTITAIAQLCILGCTWIVGIFLIEEKSIAIPYIFTILNCFQGLFIFILHCLMKKQVRDDYMRILANVCNIKRKPRYSEFTSTTQSSTSQGLKSSQETGI